MSDKINAAQEAIERMGDPINAYGMAPDEGYYADIALLERHIEGLTKERMLLERGWNNCAVQRSEAIDALTAERAAHEQTKRDRADLAIDVLNDMAEHRERRDKPEWRKQLEAWARGEE